MKPITQISELEAQYGEVPEGANRKVVNHLTPLYRKWIQASRFMVLSTVGPGGTDGSPRGEDVPAVRIRDPKTVLFADWRGNNRIDSLRNIVSDGRLSLMFMNPNSNNVVRINGTGIVTADQDLRQDFTKRKTLPNTVVVVRVSEVYFQCAKALMRSDLWKGNAEGSDLPSAGQFLREQISGFDTEKYDSEYSSHAEKTMW
ncbi:MSMEG_1061 family FMN-dependent PPOX-type flavoprotein [uncultured Roseobacter sp.]|uniref:MSMEG_1061 family FMN-dependent PPOX-type flavoprotein n=1 Tax=uncultured Roseobacter sp. TaxID=114847 RepID=UPI00261870D4|nr:MSMEG_1061 family FMN-dependent PPOX-type flavoprotein [uncultured Roseobacter sp.]